MAPTPPVPSTQTTAQRIADWATENRRTVLIALGISTVVAGGAGYYYYSSSAAAASAKRDEKKARKAVKKKSKKAAGAGKKTAEGSEVDETKDSSKTTSHIEPDSPDPLLMSKAEIEKLSKDERSKLALDLKNKGNKAYTTKRFAQAIDFYTKAIECEEQAVFYSNRAACYTNLDNSEAVIRDCTDALRLDKSYAKAINRRAAARELLGGEDNLFEALCDFTACVILDEFRTESKGQTAERVMRRYATEKAQRILASREPRLPSPMIIRAYLDAFRQRPLPTQPASPSQGDKTLFLAYDALKAFSYPHAFTLFSESVDQGISNPALEAHARCMKGTFLFLMGDPQTALSELDLSTNLDRTLVQAWVKKASVHMELGRPDEAMKDFDTAEQINSNDADVYYHRGQVFNVTDQHEPAISEYKKSAALDPDFIFSHVQLAVAHYKAGSSEKAMRMFKRYLVEYPKSAEVHNYYGEILFAEKEFDEALIQFDKALALENQKVGPKNVLPLVNQALVLATGKNDLEGADKLCEEALREDPTCEVAVQQLAQIKLQSNKVPEAIHWFSKGADMAMTEPGLASFLQFEAAAKAQLAFINHYPEHAARFGLA